VICCHRAAVGVEEQAAAAVSEQDNEGETTPIIFDGAAAAATDDEQAETQEETEEEHNPLDDIDYDPRPLATREQEKDSGCITVKSFVASFFAVLPVIGLAVFWLWGFGWNPVLTAGPNGLLQVYSIAVCGDGAAILAPPAPLVRRLEVIGDSDTAGYAIEHPHPSLLGELDCVMHGKQSTNAKKAWAALVGEQLH